LKWQHLAPQIFFEYYWQTEFGWSY
jgi:hypothetical protein